MHNALFDVWRRWWRFENFNPKPLRSECGAGCVFNGVFSSSLKSLIPLLWPVPHQYSLTKRPSDGSPPYGRDPNAEERTSARPRPNGIKGEDPGHSVHMKMWLFKCEIRKCKGRPSLVGRRIGHQETKALILFLFIYFFIFLIRNGLGRNGQSGINPPVLALNRHRKVGFSNQIESLPKGSQSRAGRLHSSPPSLYDGRPHRFLRQSWSGLGLISAANL